MHNFRNGIDFFADLIQGKVSPLLITIIIITMLIAALTGAVVKQAGITEESLAVSFLKALGGEFVGAIIFIYFFIALILFIAKVPFLNLHTTNILILGQAAMMFAITLEILVIPSVILASADSATKTILLSFIELILATLIYYVLITVVSFDNPFNLPLLIAILIFITVFASYTGFLLIDDLEKSKKKEQKELN
ncbi:hypothetical protein [Staphylococcus debuckii]|uniref:Uncharacterized protein n=1 Tax=Staphylococcus debuckii TaxID=2044912 RepID=A0ABU9EVB1_9STAP